MPFRVAAVVVLAFTLAGCSGDDDGPVSTPAETVTAPNIPAANRRVHPQTDGIYATGGSLSNLGHALEYRFDFDGLLTPWSSDSLASHMWGASGRYGVRAQSRCALHDVLSPWTVNVLILAQGRVVTDFETPALGADTTRVVDPYNNTTAGVTFSVDEPGFHFAHVGLVKNRSTSACVEPANENQKLGTGLVGTSSVGHSYYDIRADFLPEIPPGATIRVQVQLKQGKDVRMIVYSAVNVIAVVTKNSGVGTGTCGYFGEHRARVTLEYTAGQAVKHVRIDCANLVFVIDNFEIDIPQQ